jgi:pimeloyl-ACP methyl ester carboxylesterase
MQRPSDTKPVSRSVAAVETIRLRDGRMLCARRWPGAEEPAVVCLHGLLDSSEGWTPVCERLAGTRVAVDLPGFGFSDTPPSGSIDGYARDVAEGLVELGLKRFTLVGPSLGGAVATAVAELMPEQVGGLVLLAPTGFGRIHLAELAWLPGARELLTAALPFALGSRTMVMAAYRTMVTSGVPPEPELVERITARARILVEGVREATRALVDSGRGPNAFHRRQVAYDGPVSVIWGDRDRLVPPGHRHGVLKAFPQAEIELWEEMAHHPARERFDDLVAAIVRAARNSPPVALPASSSAAA